MKSLTIPLVLLLTLAHCGKVRELTESTMQKFAKDNSYWFIQISSTVLLRKKVHVQIAESTKAHSKICLTFSTALWRSVKLTRNWYQLYPSKIILHICSPEAISLRKAFLMMVSSIARKLPSSAWRGWIVSLLNGNSRWEERQEERLVVRRREPLLEDLAVETKEHQPAPEDPNPAHQAQQTS